MGRGSGQHQRHPPRCLGDILEEAPSKCPPGSLRPPETPTEAMEFLARSWSVSAAEISRALTNTLLTSPKVEDVAPPPPPADDAVDRPADLEVLPAMSPPSENHLSEHVHQIQKLELQPPPPGQPPGGSPPFSPKDGEDLKFHFRAGHRTVGGWLKDQKEKRREEARARNAQMHAATAVAGVAAAVAAVASAAFSSPAGAAVVQSASPSRTSAAIASAAAVVASHCVEMAQAMGADRAQILTVVGSAVSIHTTGDIMALTAAAATALRGAAALRARLQKGVHNELPPAGERKELGGRTSAQDFVSKGGVLLKRTRKGVLHWKTVSVYLDENLQVVIKLKSVHIGGTFVKKKKSVVIGIDSETPPWPGRETGGGSNQRAHFGIKTPGRLIEFECGNERDKRFWIEGIQQMLQSHAKMSNAVL